MRQWILRRTYALPLDLFRVLAGLLCLAYFTRQLLSFGEFTAPDGRLDHALQARMYWIIRAGLFQPGVGRGFLLVALWTGWACCCGVILGWRIRACAAAAFVVAVSLFRWNLLVMEVDDAIIQWLLLWMILLPLGRTLTLAGWRRDGPERWSRWKRADAPGAALWCLLAAACLIYLIAGPTKLTSRYWRSGFALYATLRLGVSRTRDLWGPAAVPVLRIGSWLAILVESGLPFALLRPKGSALKWAGLACQFGLHVGILLAFGLPFVNLTMIATSVLFFREEIMAAAGAGPERSLGHDERVAPAGKAAAVLVVLLACATTRDIPVLGALRNPAYALLWTGGVFQDYRLFDWIDAKNYRVDYEASAAGPDGRRVAVDAEKIFPRSMAHQLLQAYLYDVRWVYVPCARRAELKESILRRSAAAYCRAARGDAPPVSVDALVRRVAPYDPDLRSVDRRFLLEFSCRNGEAAVLRAMDPGEPAPDCAPGGRRDPLERLFRQPEG